MEPYLHGLVSYKFDKRKQLSEMAEASRLDGFKYINMIGDFAERFGLDPDFVFANKSFDTIANFAISQKEKGEFEERYFEAERLMNDGNTTRNT